MLDQINLSDIRSFVLIARLGNFTKAAERLDVSRSHVSRQVSSLEKQMGVTLFTRTTRSLRLTHAGEGLYAKCEQALEKIDEALIAAIDDVEEVRGDIKVNCVGGYLGEVVIADLVNEFMQMYPDISISLDFSSNRVNLIEDLFDIAFRLGSLDDSGVIARKLLDVEMQTLASPEYVARKGKPNHPKDLIHHDCLTGSVRKWRFYALDDTKKTVDVQVTGRLQCKNGRVLVQGAKAGNGIIRVPVIYCLQALNDGQLVQVFDEWAVPTVDFSAIYHRDRYQPSRIRTFIDFVKSRFEQMSFS